MTTAQYKSGNDNKKSDNNNKSDNNKDKVYLLLRRWGWVGHVLDHMLDYMIIGLMTIALHLIGCLIKQSTKQTIEKNYLAKSRIMANSWLNKHKNNYNHRQRQIKFGTGMRFRLRAESLELDEGLKATKKAW